MKTFFAIAAACVSLANAAVRPYWIRPPRLDHAIPSPMRLFFRLNILLAACFLSGCILDRLWETHRQLYAEDPQVLIDNVPKSGMRFRFSRPTILEQDVDWLVGQPPAWRTDRGKERFAEYILVQEGREKVKDSALRGRMRYQQTNGEYRLAEMTLPRVVALLVTPEMIAAAIETLRHPTPELLLQRLRVDLKKFHDIKLPQRHEIESVIGPPNQAGPTTATYRFRILPPATSPPIENHPIEIMLRYDARGQIQQAEGQYLRYRVHVDMQTAEAILNVR